MLIDSIHSHQHAKQKNPHTTDFSVSISSYHSRICLNYRTHSTSLNPTTEMVMFALKIMKLAKFIYWLICGILFIPRVELLLIFWTGYRYGSTLVPMSDKDKKEMKYKSEKCFKILGFTRPENVSKPSFFFSFQFTSFPEFS